MIKKILYITLLFSISTIIHSQNKRDYTWLYGCGYLVDKGIVEGNIMDFSNKGRIDTLDFYDSVADFNCEISDMDGNLLFYFKGCRVVDSTFQLMENGDSLDYGDTWDDFCGKWTRYSGSQNAIILPDPGNDNGGVGNGYYIIYKR